MRTTVAQHLVDALRLQQALRATLLGTSGVDAGGGVDAGTATDAGTGGRDAGAAEDAGEDAGEVEDAGEDAAGAP